MTTIVFFLRTIQPFIDMHILPQFPFAWQYETLESGQICRLWTIPAQNDLYQQYYWWKYYQLMWLMWQSLLRDEWWVVVNHYLTSYQQIAQFVHGLHNHQFYHWWGHDVVYLSRYQVIWQTSCVTFTTKIHIELLCLSSSSIPSILLRRSCPRSNSNSPGVSSFCDTWWSS